MKIPIEELKQLSNKYNLSHVIMFGLDMDQTQYVVTYGRSVEQCAQAADFGNDLKDELGWPEEYQIQPSRVKKLQEENKRLKKELDDIRSKN